MAIPSLRRDLRHVVGMVLQEQPQPVLKSRSPLKEKKLMPIEKYKHIRGAHGRPPRPQRRPENYPK